MQLCFSLCRSSRRHVVRPRDPQHGFGGAASYADDHISYSHRNRHSTRRCRFARARLPTYTYWVRCRHFDCYLSRGTKGVVVSSPDFARIVLTFHQNQFKRCCVIECVCINQTHIDPAQRTTMLKRRHNVRYHFTQLFIF